MFTFNLTIRPYLNNAHAIDILSTRLLLPNTKNNKLLLIYSKTKVSLYRGDIYKSLKISPFTYIEYILVQVHATTQLSAETKEEPSL